jgi:hypothetical protein
MIDSRKNCLERARTRGTAPPAASLRMVTCAGCGAQFDPGEWAPLVLLERIGPQEVGRLLLNWPERLCIEVRSCARCGGAIAAKRPVSRS